MTSEKLKHNQVDSDLRCVLHDKHLTDGAKLAALTRIITNISRDLKQEEYDIIVSTPQRDT